jgi:hypothetical protein
MLAARQEWRASFILLGSRPFIEARRSLTVEDGAERLLDVVGGIDAVQLAGRHEEGEHAPVFGAHIRLLNAIRSAMTLVDSVSPAAMEKLVEQHGLVQVPISWRAFYRQPDA